MSAPSPIRKAVEAIVACTLVAVVAFYGTVWFLGSPLGPDLDPTPPDLPAAIVEEPNEFRADLMAAAFYARTCWSYAEHRAAIDGVDLDAREAEALAMLGESPDAATFQRALTYFATGLHDGHAFALTSDYTVPGRQRWPFSLREVTEGICVTGVADEVTGLEVGDLLRSVDGRPIESWIEDAEDLVYASTDEARRRMAIDHLADWDDAEVREFTFERQGESFTATLRLPRSFTEVPELEIPPSHRQHEMLDGEVGYFRPANFSPPPDSGWPGPPEGRDAILADTYAAFDQHIGALQGAQGLILDLRGNPGGTDLLGQFLVDRLVEGDYTYFRLSSRGRRGWRGYGKHGSTAIAGEHSLAGRPLVVLIDAYTFSTADNVAACLRDVHPDVRFVGRPNGAGSGAPRPFALPRTGASITFCTQRVQGPAGTMTEGVPVQPDVRVAWTRDDLLTGRDPDLAAARELLRR